MLRDLAGVGTDVASQLLVIMGDNPERLTTEANSQPWSASPRSPPHRKRRTGIGLAGPGTGRPTKPSTALSL
jgi:hypothetical protein